MRAPDPLNSDGTISDEFADHLQTVAKEYDRAEAVRLGVALADALAAATPQRADRNLKRTLGSFRGLRLYESVRLVTDAFLVAHPGEAVAQRQHAQALIENGELSNALLVLRGLAASTAGTDLEEHAEARGLIGRVHKQLYIDNPTAAHSVRIRWLQTAAEAYHDAYRESGDLVWHGVNTVAVLYRASIDGVALSGMPSLRELAEEVLATVEGRLALAESASAIDPWDLATAMESSVALDRMGRALGYAYRYAEHSVVTAFQLNSTLRQLEEVWDLDREVGGDKQELVDRLRNRLLEMPGGVLEISPAEVEETVLQHGGEIEPQAAFGTEDGTEVPTLARAMNVARSVPQVRNGQKPLGSAFLAWSDEVGFVGPRTPVLLTNNHVISTDPTISLSVRPRVAKVWFHSVTELPGVVFSTGIASVLWESAPDALDVTIALLKEVPEGIPPLTVAPDPIVLPPPELGAEPPSVHTVGFPDDKFKVTLPNHRVVGLGETTLQYRIPTDFGSSGGPVLDDTWHVVGIHRGATPEANVGSLLLAVKAAVEAEGLSVPETP